MRRLLAIVLLSVLLGACGSSETPNTLTQAPQAPAGPTVVVPKTDLTSVVLGSVTDSKAAAILAVTNPSPGSPDPAVHDILVLDGSQGVTSSSIAAFLEAGKTVTLLNVSEDLKRNALRQYAPLLAQSTCKVLALRQSVDQFGRAEFFAMEWPENPGDDSLAFQQRFVEFLGQPSANQDGFNPPAGLIYVTFNYSYTPTALEFNTTYGGRQHFSTGQFTSLTNDYTYRLFLDNGDNATGDRQILAVESSIRSSPFNPAQGTDGMLIQKSGGFSPPGTWAGSNIA